MKLDQFKFTHNKLLAYETKKILERGRDISTFLSYLAATLSISQILHLISDFLQFLKNECPYPRALR